MSVIQPIVPKLDSVDSIYHYLRESPPTEVVSSTTPSSVVDTIRTNKQIKSTKKSKKEKETANLMNNLQADPRETVQRLPSGRISYGPITVNPRKQPSKTLFTGRRSKYEVLSEEEEEKRRLRRERNRVAATKCRVKRDDVLNDLEKACDYQSEIYANLLSTVQQLEQRRLQLQSLLANYPLQQINPMPQQTTTRVFGNTGFLSSIPEAPAPRLPPHQLQLIANDEEEFARFLQPEPVLTNSAYNSDQTNYLFNSQQQQQTITMTTSSIERFINDLDCPTSYVDNNNNNASQGLINSAYGSSTCAQQHSSSSEDDSITSTHKNSFVF